MTKYAVVYEETPSGGWSAYVPDLPGCIAAGRTRGSVRRLIRGAIQFHLEGLRLHGEDPPAPTSRAGSVSVG